MDLQLEAAIARGRVIRRVPDVVRARLRARARSIVAASELGPAFSLMPAPSWRRRRLRIGVAATVVLILAAAGARAAFDARAAHAPEVLAASSPVPKAPLPWHPAREIPRIMPAPALARAPRPLSSTNIRRLGRWTSPRESYAAEIELLQRAQSQYASHDFPDALVLVAEHARRFPNGHLAEEREALRVQSLAGAGRVGEAGRAFAVFARRFPQSVLSPRLQEMIPGPVAEMR